MIKLPTSLAIFLLVSIIPLVTFSSPVHETVNDEATHYGHPSIDIWNNASTTTVGRGPGMDIFSRFVLKPFPYGFIEFLRQGTTFIHHQQSLPTRVTSYLKRQWNRVADFMPMPMYTFNESTNSASNNNNINHHHHHHHNDSSITPVHLSK